MEMEERLEALSYVAQVRGKEGLELLMTRFRGNTEAADKTALGNYLPDF